MRGAAHVLFRLSFRYATLRFLRLSKPDSPRLDPGRVWQVRGQGDEEGPFLHEGAAPGERPLSPPSSPLQRRRLAAAVLPSARTAFGAPRGPRGCGGAGRSMLSAPHPWGGDWLACLCVCARACVCACACVRARACVRVRVRACECGADGPVEADAGAGGAAAHLSRRPARGVRAADTGDPPPWPPAPSPPSPPNSRPLGVRPAAPPPPRVPTAPHARAAPAG